MAAEHVQPADLYFIWSNHHQGWWRPGGYGYATRLSEAGRFPRDKAMEHAKKAQAGQRVEDMLPEILVPVRDILELASG